MKSSADVDGIDAAILALAHQGWQKVALIVGTVLTAEGHDRWPLGLVVRRVAALVERGELESQGRVRRMHYSEIRRPQRG